MSDTPTIEAICRSHGNDGSRLLDIARDVQAHYGCVSSRSMEEIAACLNVRRVEVESLVTFYAFLSAEPKGKIVIRVCDDVVDRLFGAHQVLEAFADELGVAVGETTADGRFTLEKTACTGMSDQAPAALVNDVPVTELSTDRAREIVRTLRRNDDPRVLVRKVGDGNNAHPLVQSMVRNNVHMPGDVIFSPIRRGEALEKALQISAVEVIRAVKTARLRGRGGAGFPTGMKWEFARMAPGERKYVFCNADEGEPGTFKDRVLLTELPDRVFAGMTIAGYAVGADEGILYLRAEYAYLREFLEDVLEQRRKDKLLGEHILGIDGAHFDIRIQMGAGAYVCGEETALLSSCEGMRGDPWNRPPFPAQKGYLGFPTIVNNVETLCCVSKILHEGPATFARHGNTQSSGTKLLSVSGDCRRPGIYELPFGTPLREVLEHCGGEDAYAIQVGGPSGRLVSRDALDRVICFDDLATGGAITVFGPDRDVIEIVLGYQEFFEEETCGYCTPCRVGCTLLRREMERVLAGRGEPIDLEQLEDVSRMMAVTSRCGLGQTAGRPFLTSRESFPEVYEKRIALDGDGFRRSFDLAGAVAEAGRIRRESDGSQLEGGARLMSGEIELTIDDKDVTGRVGQTILEIADEAGIYIPRLCHRPGLEPYGSCRVCTVIANGRPTAACVWPATMGMIVETDSPELVAHRRLLVEMLFVEGNHFCAFCEKSGNCELQALAYRLGISAPRFDYLYPDREVDASHPDILIDHNRCILCARCIRASRDVDDKGIFHFVGRGATKRIAVNAEARLADTDVAATDHALDVCPVGALLRKRVGYRVPIGKREFDEEPIGSDVEARRSGGES